MTDLTAITTPYGLLDAATQEALKAHGGPYEAFFQHAGLTFGWGVPERYMKMNEMRAIAWRVKPAPPKPRERWATSQILHETREKAEDFRAQLIAENPGMDFPPIVRFIEAID